MSVRAPVGDLNLAYEDCCVGRGLAAIHCARPSFGLYLMRSLHEKLDAYNGEGTVFGSINGKTLKGLPIALPEDVAIDAFEKEVSPIDAQIRSNEAESRLLVALRDTLLPKLMSGEIDVSKVDLTQLNSHLAVRLSICFGYSFFEELGGIMGKQFIEPLRDLGELKRGKKRGIYKKWITNDECQHMLLCAYL